MHALKDYFARCTIEPQHAFVAQHARAECLHQATDKFFQLTWVKRALAAENKCRDVVGMSAVRMSVSVIITVCLITAVVIVIMRTVLVAGVIVIIGFEKIRINLEFLIQVEAANIQNLIDGCFTKFRTHDGCARIDLFQPCFQGMDRFRRYQIGL